MTQPAYEKTARKKFKSTRQCTWIGDDGVRCNKPAKGCFFCARHYVEATKMERGSFSTYAAIN